MWGDGGLEAPNINWENTPVIQAESEPLLVGPVKTTVECVIISSTTEIQLHESGRYLSILR